MQQNKKWTVSSFGYKLNFGHKFKKSNWKCGPQAFADSWAVALDCDYKCVVDAETAAESFREVLAVAASHAYGSVCVGERPLPFACTQSGAQQCAL